MSGFRFTKSGKSIQFIPKIVKVLPDDGDGFFRLWLNGDMCNVDGDNLELDIAIPLETARKMGLSH